MQELRNCGFFRLRGERIVRMLVYHPIPDAVGGAGAPTGYPPQGWQPEQDNAGAEGDAG